MAYIPDQFWVMMKGGKRHPTYPGVLDAATREGLRSLTSELIQIPTAENGHVAIVKGRAVFRDETGERFYESLGDASPDNTGPMVRTALIRMAETRALGRCLRNGINMGETLADEIPDGDREERPPAAVPVTPRAVNNPAPESSGDAGANGDAFCQECGVGLTPGQKTVSLRRFGAPYCPLHQAGRKVTTDIA